MLSHITGFANIKSIDGFKCQLSLSDFLWRSAIIVAIFDFWGLCYHTPTPRRPEWGTKYCVSASYDFAFQFSQSQDWECVRNVFAIHRLSRVQITGSHYICISKCHLEYADTNVVPQSGQNQLFLRKQYRRSNQHMNIKK